MGTQIGALAVRRSVWINAIPERVWREFETFDRFRAWYGTGHELLVYEPRVGGRLEFESDPGVQWGGHVLVFDPPHELTFEDVRLPQVEGRPKLYITYRLTPHMGGTHVEFFVHGFEDLGDVAGDRLQGLEGGWRMIQLNNLRALVEGR
jgi:uncharacterized protein YndB with AHSA1/START domain